MIRIVGAAHRSLKHLKIKNGGITAAVCHERVNGWREPTLSAL
jgi:hypothetical protein